MTAGPGDDAAPYRGRRSAPGLVAAAGGLGLAGVALSAAAAHSGGGQLVATAGQFCLLHAAAVLGLTGLTPIFTSRWIGLLAAYVIVFGTAVFAADLALAGLVGIRPFPPAAPIGGGLLLVGWGLVIIAGLRDLSTSSRRKGEQAHAGR